ncbi:hypothetical protein [Kosakonia cowanii]|jgi:hypothetical protein|uniref:hypothetical protein n=1 Tax=Kosakonia cowanii TaxID=208223 RepID=UPI00289F135A|nr:hypothetical protein [Kosakonia cowanii]
MKVKCLGFSITNENENINTADVFAKFITSSERVHHGTDQSRQILMKDDGDFYSGLVLTYRNQKKNCKSKIENGKFQLKVEDLTGDEKLVSFNFFSLKKSNLKGLFMYHYGSCPISGLFNNLQTMSNEHIREQNKLEIEQLGTKPKQKHIKAVNKKYNKRLEFNILVTKKDVQSILSEFKKINSAVFKLNYMDFKGGPMTAVEPFAKTTDIVFNIEPSERSKVGILSQRLADVYKNVTQIAKAKVIAVDHSNQERIVNFMNCPTFFDEYDYDFIAGHVDGLTNDNYTTNAVLDIIKEQILNGKNKNVFN